MNSEYWKIFCDEVVPDLLGVTVSKEQVNKLHKAAMNHREMEYDYCGYREADISVTKINEKEAQYKVISMVEKLMEEMDGGSGRFFEMLNERQKMAIATLGNFRSHFETEQRTKG